jgi:hypothetical protein
MIVLASSSPSDDGAWRWRIVGYTCDDVIEESTASFPTMTSALAAGQLRVVQINARGELRDHPVSPGITFSEYH